MFGDRLLASCNQYHAAGHSHLRESFEIHDDCRIHVYVKSRPLSEPKIREGSDGAAVTGLRRTSLSLRPWRR